jgi:hypothetical protein
VLGSRRRVNQAFRVSTALKAESAVLSECGSGTSGRLIAFAIFGQNRDLFSIGATRATQRLVMLAHEGSTGRLERVTGTAAC